MYTCRGVGLVLHVFSTLPSLPYMCPLDLSRGCVENSWRSTSTPLRVHWTYHVAGFRISGALPILYYICALNVSRGCIENKWTSTSRTLHVSTELFIKWLGWECLGLYLQSPSCVHWTFYLRAGFGNFGPQPRSPNCVYSTFYRVAALRIGGALSPLPYMCPLNLSRVWVENGWSSTSTPLHVSIELFITWLCWESVNLLHPLSYMCPLNLSRCWFEKGWSSTCNPQHVSSEIFITWLGWEWVEL